MMSNERRPFPIRALVVDDESLARRNVAVLLGRDPEIGSVTECSSGLAALEEIRRSRPDLVFLDVQMPECDGFDVLELLGSDVPPVVIFVTAYDEHALRAFEVGALDYLLKPFDDARFGRAVQRAKEKLIHVASGQPGKETRLAVKKELVHDASCGNKQWFSPLAAVHHAEMGTTLENAYTGASLGTKWSDPDKRSSYFGMFSYEQGS